jgi:signal transduction histidine kinase
MSVLGEAAVLPVATRVGALALGEKLSWEPEQLRQEAWGSLLFLGGMRLVTVGAGLVPARGKALLGAVGSRGAGPLLGGIALGQQFETWAGLRAPTEGSARLFEILSTYGQIWGAGVLAGGLLGHHFVRWERAAEARVEAMKGSASRDIAHIAAQWSSAPEFSGKTKSGKGGDTWSGGPKRLDLPSHFAMNSRDSSTASTLPPPPRARPLGRDEATRDSGITHVEPSSPPLPSGHFRIRRTNPPSGHPDPDLAVRLDDTITALRTSEAYQRALTQAIPDPVFSLRRVPGERDFQFVAIHAPNPAELLFPADQLFQTSLARLPLDPALLEFGLAALEEALQQPGTIVEIEYDAATPSGIISQEARIVAHGSEELVVFVRDITNRKAEEAKRESLLREAAEQRLAQERADALQLVSRGLAHEFNNVLQGMMVQLDFMQHPFAGLLEVAQALMKPDADFGSQLREARAELMGIATRGIASRRHGNPAVAPPPETPEELVREIAKIMGNILGQSVQDLAEARQHTDRFQGMITHFMRQTADPIPVQPFDLHSLLTTAYLKSHFSKPPVFSLEQVELSLDPEAKPIWGHRELAHVVRNLLINAKEALKAQTQPKIEISTRRVTLGPEDISLLLPWSPLANLPTGAFLVLQVRDNGIGMDEATRQRIFDSGFTTKQRTLDHSGNHGLGLPFSLKLMKDIGGMMTVESEPGKGTVFQAFFPEAPLPNP